MSHSTRRSLGAVLSVPAHPLWRIDFPGREYSGIIGRRLLKFSEVCVVRAMHLRRPVGSAERCEASRSKPRRARSTPPADSSREATTPVRNRAKSASWAAVKGLGKSPCFFPGGGVRCRRPWQQRGRTCPCWSCGRRFRSRKSFLILGLQAQSQF